MTAKSENVELSDVELVDQALSGHSGAFGQIFARHRERAFALAIHYLRNYEDAKDVVQDAFIKAYQNLRRFDRQRSFGPWLLTIVRNLSVDRLRRRKHTVDTEFIENFPDSHPDRADSQVLQHEVWAALQSLSVEHREIIVLKDYQGHSYVEIAEILSIPLGTVMSRLHHARRNLMAKLRGICPQ